MTGSTSPFSQVGTAELGSYPRGWIGFALRIALKVRLSIPLQSALAPRGPVACKLAAAVLKALWGQRVDPAADWTQVVASFPQVIPLTVPSRE